MIDKRFMETKDPNLFPDVKKKGNTAKVFFVISCVRLGFGIVILLSLIFVFSDAADFPLGNLSAGFSLLSFSNIFTLTTFIIGLNTVNKFKQAEKAYSELPSGSKGSVGGFNNANAYGAFPAGGFNSANNNGANNSQGTSFGSPNTASNNNNTNTNINPQSGYQSNLHTNDPAQLRSSTGDQSPFEAPPPNYYNYNYGSYGGNQQGRPNAAPPYNNRQNGQQKASSSPSLNNSANHSQPSVNNSANAKKTEPKQYVSQMPEVTPFSETKPSTAAYAPANTAAVPQSTVSAPQKPAVPVILPAVPEIKREATVRCKHCGVTNKAEDKFCTFCGKSLSE